VTRPSAGGTLAHTKHYACDRMRRYEGDPAYARRSAVRLGRALELLDGRMGRVRRRFGHAEILRAALSDHATTPSICRHDDGAETSVTVFWCLADVTAGRSATAAATPCAQREATYRFG